MFLLMSHLLRDRVAPRTRMAQAAWGGPEDGHERGGGASRRPVMAPTRVLSRSCEGKLRVDVLRQADEEVAISFILSLWAGHAPDPHPNYTGRPAKCNENPPNLIAGRSSAVGPTAGARGDVKDA